MRLLANNFFLVLTFVLSATFISAQTTAFVGANVIPMDKERVLQNQTVIVRNGVITEIGDAKKVKIPKDAQRVEARGKYLIPGLTDMHVHLMSDDEAFPESLSEDELKIMVAYGVTTIRFMGGTPEQLTLRAKSAKGEIMAPLIYAASPMFAGKKGPNTYVVTTEQEGREAVRKSKQEGYDYLKMTTDIKPEVYEAIVDEAKKQNIKVIGHADSRSIGLQRALKAGQQIEHLDSYMEALLPENSPIKGSVSDIYIYRPDNWKSIDIVDENKIPEIARASVKANPFTTPTLHLFKFTFGRGRTEETFKAQSDIRFFPQKNIDFWAGVSKRYLKTAVPIETREKYIGLRNKIVKAIYDAGGKIMAGSDTPEWVMLYGHTLHLEMIDLRDAGLSNYAALESATRNPAEFFRTLNQTGTVAKGKRADLVLLNSNPLENISNTQNRAGVMLKGKYYAQADLDKWLDETAPKFQHALDGAK